MLWKKINQQRLLLRIFAQQRPLQELEARHLIRSLQLYPSGLEWLLYLRYLSLFLASSLLVSGVVFFFAFNWQDMHKFTKLGLLAALVLLSGLGSLYPRFSPALQKSLLTASAMLIGVLYAVFGQIYQTGANSFDFFLSWTVSIFLFALAGRFLPLWALFLFLLQLSLISYSKLLSYGWPEYLLFLLLALLNFSAVAFWEMSRIRGILKDRRSWFPDLFLLLGSIAATLAAETSIFNNFRNDYGLLLMGLAVLYWLGISFGLRQRRLVYPGLLGLSCIAVTAGLLGWLLQDSLQLSFIVVSLFILGSSSFLVIQLIAFHRKWSTL